MTEYVVLSQEPKMTQVASLRIINAIKKQMTREEIENIINKMLEEEGLDSRIKINVDGTVLALNYLDEVITCELSENGDYTVTASVKTPIFDLARVEKDNSFTTIH